PDDFARLVRVAEEVKVELSEKGRVEDVGERLRAAGLWRQVCNLPGDQRQATNLPPQPMPVTRDAFQALIKAKVHRTVDCCHEALARAKEKADIRLSDIDYVILVGGSSRIPYVRDTIRAAFCNEALPEHVRCTRPLLHEPDLCVAYGAALRGAGHGTRYVFSIARQEGAPAELPD